MGLITYRMNTRIGYWKGTAGLIGLLTGLTALFPSRPMPDLGMPAKSTKPNVIFLLTDDHRWDALGAMGNTVIKTPHLDALAKEGILFRKAYVTTAICSISRASLLSGQYESRHRISDFATDFTPQALANTYPMLLRKAGYHIGFVGKYGVGENPPADQFDYWACNKKGQPPYWYINQSGQPIHHTDSVAHSVQLFLDQFGNEGPFCLSVSFKAPHELDGNPPTYPVQERYKALYNDTAMIVPETADPNYWASFPDFFRTDENLARARWKPLFSTPALHQETVRNYYRLITGVDEVVGTIVAQLKRLNIDKNTVIVFMGDNGFYLGEHGMEGKWYGHEASIRVPLLMHGTPLPARLKGRSSNRIALNIDIAPTILALAGVTTPARMQGIDLVQTLQQKTPAHRDFFYEHRYLGSPKLPQVEGVVGQPYKYMTFIEHQYEQLYNTDDDPNETRNLATDTHYADVLQKLRKRHSYWKKEAQ